MTKLLRLACFLFLLLVGILLCWHSLGASLHLAFNSNEHTHILLIVPLTCILIFVERKAFRPDLNPSPALGSVLLGVALLVGLFARLNTWWPEDIRLSLSMFALVTWWIGSVVFCFGIRTFQAFLFPLCFLLWVIPIPDFALDATIHSLQQQSAFAARVLFLMAGVPVTQDGIMLVHPDLDIEVAPECSSIRSSLMLLITSLLLAHLFLRSGWRKAVFVLAAIPLAAVKNGLRIFTIVELGTRVDPGFFNGKFHHRGGIIFFAISLGMMAVLLWQLRRSESLEGVPV